MDEVTSGILLKYQPKDREALIPILQDIQDHFGYLSELSVAEVGRYLDLPSVKIYGLATFYNQFRFEPAGKYLISLCSGTNCHVKGVSEIRKELQKVLRIKPGETTRDGMFTLELVACIGACHLAPVIRINSSYYTKLSVSDVAKIVQKYINGEDQTDE